MPPKRLKSRNWIRENNKNYDAISYIWNVFFFFFFFQLALINIFSIPLVIICLPSLTLPKGEESLLEIKSSMFKESRNRRWTFENLLFDFFMKKNSYSFSYHTWLCT